MKSIRNIEKTPKGIPVTSDEVLENHAARVMLLITICGSVDRRTKLPRIEGLTKLAKLDFFVRYPSFFRRLRSKESKTKVPEPVESSMIRHNYGPWDPRYYQILPYLEARGLIRVEKNGNQFQFAITEKGAELARELTRHPAFQKICEHMQKVKGELGRLSGYALKNLVYETFDSEVTAKAKGERI